MCWKAVGLVFFRETRGMGLCIRLALAGILLMPLAPSSDGTGKVWAAPAGKIFSGQRTIIINTADSHSPHKHLQEYLDRHFGGAGKSPIVSSLNRDANGAIFGRHMPLNIDQHGNPTVAPAGHGMDWLAGLPGQIAGKRKSLDCPDCRVVFFGYMNNPSRHNGKKQLNARDSYLVADSTDKAEVARAVGWAKFVADKIREAGVDFVFLSTPIKNYSHGRFIENYPAVTREFNRKYFDSGYTYVDMVTPIHKDYTLAAGGDRLHPSPYGWYYYGKEWYKAMLRHDGLPIPSWIDEIEAKKKAEYSKNRATLTYKGPMKGAYALGDTIDIRFESSCLDGRPVEVHLHWLRRDRILDDRMNHFQRINILPETMPYCLPRAAWNHEHSYCCNKDYPEFGGRVKWGLYRFVVTPEIFKIRDASKTYTLTQPYAAYFQVHQTNTYLPIWASSTIDYDNPENMIVLHPTPKVDPKAPIYPQQLETTSAKPRASAHSLEWRKTGLEIRVRVERSEDVAELLDARGRSLGIGTDRSEGERVWSTADFQPGIYWLRLRRGNHIETAAIPVMR